MCSRITYWSLIKPYELEKSLNMMPGAVTRSEALGPIGRHIHNFPIVSVPPAQQQAVSSKVNCDLMPLANINYQITKQLTAIMSGPSIFANHEGTSCQQLQARPICPT